MRNYRPKRWIFYSFSEKGLDKERHLKLDKQGIYRGKLFCMKKYQFILSLCLFLIFSLPVAFAGETPAARTLPEAGLQEHEKAVEPGLLTVASTDEKPVVNTVPAVAQHEQKDLSDNAPANTGYNLQAYNSNAVASKAVEKNIGLFSNTIRERFSMWLGRSGKYIDLMKENPQKKDIPENIDIPLPY